MVRVDTDSKIDKIISLCQLNGTGKCSCVRSGYDKLLYTLTSGTLQYTLYILIIFRIIKMTMCINDHRLNPLLHIFKNYTR